ncbi:MAG TPA: hypothetical protein VFO52_01870 [Longimicrobiales bacterium]|nr:hypothetical protein [Longimicrobiales bacterium]
MGTIESGFIHVMRFYDIAYEIDLEALQASANTAATRIRLKRTEPKAVDFGVPPLELALGGMAVTELGLTGEVSARIFEFGVASISIRFAVSGVEWNELARLTNAIDQWANREEPWRWLEQVMSLVEPHAARPSVTQGLSEDYLIVAVRSTSQPVSISGLMASDALVTLLAGETRPLAPGARSDLLKNTFSYYTTDLAVITWDRAFLYEPEGDTDVTEVIEVANAQLLELRYYDMLLDEELPRMYRRVQNARKRFRILGRSYAKLAHELYGQVAEVTQITERIDNALKVTEDVYLARIYSAVGELFRLRSWNVDVERKLGIIRDTYSALNDDATHARAELLELGIFLLIVFEVVVGLLLR